MLIRARAGALGDHPDLIQRQLALPQRRHTTRKLLQPLGHRGDPVSVTQRRTQLPGNQRRHRPRTSRSTQLVALHLRGDLHNATINYIALTRQLRKLLEQHPKPLIRRDGNGARRHSHMMAGESDKFRGR
jgi:hypothetical protein